jgi:chromosome segregation ATPase
MKKITPQQKVKLDNFQAQYNAIVGKLDTANKELEMVLFRQQAAELSLNTAEKERVIAEKAKKASEKKVVDLLNDIDDKNKKLDERQAFLDDRESLIGKAEAAKIEDAEAEVVLLTNEAQDLRDEIQELKTERYNATLELDHVAELIGIAESSYDVRREQMAIIEQRISDGEGSLAQLNTEYNTIIRKHESELDDLKEQISNAVEAVERPMQNLLAKEQDLEKREKDVKVYIKRLQRIYKEEFPELRLHL